MEICSLKFLYRHHLLETPSPMQLPQSLTSPIRIILPIFNFTFIWNFINNRLKGYVALSGDYHTQWLLDLSRHIFNRYIGGIVFLILLYGSLLHLRKALEGGSFSYRIFLKLSSGMFVSPIFSAAV